MGSMSCPDQGTGDRRYSLAGGFINTSLFDGLLFVERAGFAVNVTTFGEAGKPAAVEGEIEATAW